MNTIKRTYTYRLENCDFSVLPIIACDSNTVQATYGQTCFAHCNDKTITFRNESIGALSYHWDFGVAALSDDTSSLAEPTFTYPDTGRYKVTLIAYGSTCTDSISEYVNIYSDELSADINFTGNLCIGDSIQFSGSATSLNDSINFWKWDFINGTSDLASHQQNPLIRFEQSGNYHVFLSAFNHYGCYATKEKEVTLASLDVRAYADTIVPVGSSVYLHVSGAETYHWDLYRVSISTLLSFSEVRDPIAFEVIPGEYWYIVTGMNSDGCIGKDTAKVTFTSNATVFVPNVFSPNGDHLNDEVKIFLSGYDLVYFRIFNRRGQEVFQTTDKKQVWDGTFNKDQLGLDSYYWVACVKDATTKVKIFKGDIILMR